MKKHSRLPKASRLIVLLAALLLTVSATSCATTNQPSESASNLTTTIESEASTESSESSDIPPESSVPEESNITSTVWQPKIPEERSSDIFLCDSFPFGEGGLTYSIAHVSEDDPDRITVCAPDEYFVYSTEVFMAASGNSFVDPKRGEGDISGLPPHLPGRCCWYNDTPDCYYAISMDGQVFSYLPGYGLEYYPNANPHPGQPISGNIVAYENSVLLQTAEGFYNLDGQKATDLPFAVEQVGEGEYTLTIDGKLIDRGPYFEIVLAAYDEILVRQYSMTTTEQGMLIETIVKKYDYQGNPLSACLISRQAVGERPCEIPVGDGKVCKQYDAWTVTLGDTVWEDVVDFQMYVDPLDREYFIIVYPDRVDLHYVHDFGYSDVSFTQSAN